MKIAGIVGALGLALLCGVAHAQDKEGTWWAVSISETDHWQPPRWKGSWKRNYGAAWGFATKQAAMEAANKECEKHGPVCWRGGLVGSRRCMLVFVDSWGGYQAGFWFRDRRKDPVVLRAADVRRLFAEYARHEVANGHAAPKIEMYHCPTTGETWQRGK